MIFINPASTDDYIFGCDQGSEFGCWISNAVGP